MLAFVMARAATAKTLLAVALLAALTVFCVSDLVMAAMPQDDTAACVDLFCDRQSACGATNAKAVALPVAAPAVEPPATILLSVTVEPTGLEAQTCVTRQVVPRAPRSPPPA